MNLPVRKLRAQKGETLLETLGSILIIGLSCVIFAVMTMAGAGMNARVRVVDDARFAQLADAEAHSGTESGSVTISWSGGAQTFSVFYTGQDRELCSYEAEGGG